MATVIFSLTCRHEQKVVYVSVQTLGPFPQNYVSPKGWKFKVFGQWTRKISPLFNSFKCFTASAKDINFRFVQKSLYCFCAISYEICKALNYIAWQLLKAKLDHCLQNKQFGTQEAAFLRPKNVTAHKSF